MTLDRQEVESLVSCLRSMTKSYRFNVSSGHEELNTLARAMALVCDGAGLPRECVRDAVLRNLGGSE